jgi:hypothetical protein
MNKNQSVETAEVEKEEEVDSDRSMLYARLLGHCLYPEMVIGVGSQGVKVCLISDCSHPHPHPSEAQMAHC